MVLSYDVLSSILSAQRDPRSIFYTHSSPSCPAINGEFSGSISADPWFLDEVSYQYTQPPTIPPQPPPVHHYQHHFLQHEPGPFSHSQQSYYPQPPPTHFAQQIPCSPPTSSPTLKLIKFSGSDPNFWLMNTELYFLQHPWPLETRFDFIALHLEGFALTWFQLWRHQLDSWEKFREVFKFQFITCKFAQTGASRSEKSSTVSNNLQPRTAQAVESNCTTMEKPQFETSTVVETPFRSQELAIPEIGLHSETTMGVGSESRSEEILEDEPEHVPNTKEQVEPAQVDEKDSSHRVDTCLVATKEVFQVNSFNSASQAERVPSVTQVISKPLLIAPNLFEKMLVTRNKKICVANTFEKLLVTYTKQYLDWHRMRPVNLTSEIALSSLDVPGMKLFDPGIVQVIGILTLIFDQHDYDAISRYATRDLILHYSAFHGPPNTYPIQATPVGNQSQFKSWEDFKSAFKVHFCTSYKAQFSELSTSITTAGLEELGVHNVDFSIAHMDEPDTESMDSSEQCIGDSCLSFLGYVIAASIIQKATISVEDHYYSTLSTSVLSLQASHQRSCFVTTARALLVMTSFCHSSDGTPPRIQTIRDSVSMGDCNKIQEAVMYPFTSQNSKLDTAAKSYATIAHAWQQYESHHVLDIESAFLIGVFAGAELSVRCLSAAHALSISSNPFSPTYMTDTHPGIYTIKNYVGMGQRNTVNTTTMGSFNHTVATYTGQKSLLYFKNVMFKPCFPVAECQSTSWVSYKIALDPKTSHNLFVKMPNPISAAVCDGSPEPLDIMVLKSDQVAIHTHDLHVLNPIIYDPDIFSLGQFGLAHLYFLIMDYYFDGSLGPSSLQLLLQQSLLAWHWVNKCMVFMWQCHSTGVSFLWHSIVVDKTIIAPLAIGRGIDSCFSEPLLKIHGMEFDKTCLVCFRPEFISRTLYSFHELCSHSTTLLEWILIIAWIVYFSSLRTRMFSRGW